MSEENSGPPRKKTRGPYKAWMNKLSGPPRNTARYRQKRLEGIADVDEPTSDNVAGPSENQPSLIDVETENTEAGVIQENDQQTGEPTEHTAEGADNEFICVGGCVCGSGQCIQIQAEIDARNRQQVATQPKDKYKWDEPLTPFTKTTKFEALLAILHLGLRHGMNGPLIVDLLKFVNFLFGETVVPPSQHIFQKLFSPKYPVQFHIYCSVCEVYFGNRDSLEAEFTCENCGTKCDPKTLENNFFLTVSLKEQMEYILKQQDVSFVSKDRVAGMYCDVVDGEIYRKLREPGNLMENPNSLSVTFNVDGAQVFRSAKGSLWPLQCVINELSPEIRFRCDNVILCALWFGKGSPNMSTFLTPFKNELKGMVVSRPGPDSSQISCPVFGLFCSVDSIAKPKVLNSKQFNGSFGCGYCLHPNLPVDGLPSNQLRYVAVKPDGSKLRFPNRTHESVLSDMIEAFDLDEAGLLIRSRVGSPEETLDHVRGLLGMSILADMDGFDLSFGFSVDYLHQLLNGVTNTTVDLLCDGPMKSKIYWKDKKYDIAKLDARLESIKPPQSMSTRSKAISKRSEWKAKDFRSLLLFYMLPCMQDLLATPVFSTLQKLVTAAFILLSDKISVENLDYADTLLQEFVNEFNALFGSCNMTYNVHLCTHLALSVKMLSPLWADSTFVYESGNGRLTRLVTGTRGVVTQIFRKYLTVQCIPEMVESHNVSAEALEFCSDVIGYNYVKKTQKFSDCRAFGSENLATTSDELRTVLEENDIVWGLNTHTYFNRATRGGVMYYCKAYKKPERFDDTCVVLVDDTFAVIEKFMKIPCETSLMILIRPIRIVRSSSLAPHIFTCAQDMYEPLKLLPMDQVKSKCVRVKIDGIRGGIANYVCKLPNTYEKD